MTKECQSCLRPFNNFQGRLNILSCSFDEFVTSNSLYVNGYHFFQLLLIFVIHLHRLAWILPMVVKILQYCSCRIGGPRESNSTCQTFVKVLFLRDGSYCCYFHIIVKLCFFHWVNVNIINLPVTSAM